MVRPNLRIQITQHLKDVYPNYIHNGRLQRMAEEFGYMGSTWDRRGIVQIVALWFVVSEI
jgi:hypothetical protein